MHSKISKIERIAKCQNSQWNYPHTEFKTFNFDIELKKITNFENLKIPKLEKFLNSASNNFNWIKNSDPMLILNGLLLNVYNFKFSHFDSNSYYSHLYLPFIF